MAEHETRLDPAELLGELDWLRRLARSLVGRVGAEEDLVQDTWLAASRVEGGVSRPWLVRTLRQLAARWHRAESRRRRRERTAARAEAVDTDALLERGEVLGLVLEELRAVDEPFRTALILLYQEGLTVREAAARLDVKEDTLRWRHRQGLERLRGRLDDGPCTDWRACLLPLAGQPAFDLAAGATAAKTATLLGGSLMTWKTTALLVGACLAVPLVLWVLGDEPVQPGGTPDVAPSLAGSAPSLDLDEPQPSKGADRSLVPAPGADAGTPAAVADAVPAGGLAVTVVDATGQPVPQAEVWLGRAPDPVGTVAVSDAGGVAHLPLPEASSFYVSGLTASLYGRVPVLRGLAGGEVRLVLTPDADVPVLVVDERGDPVAGVPVGIVRTKTRTDPLTGALRELMNFHDVVETDAEGRAVVRHVGERLRTASESIRFAVGPALLLANRADVPLTRSDLPRETLRFVLPPLGSLELRVLDAQGAPNRAATEVRVLIDPAPDRPREVSELVDEARFGAAGLVTVALEDGVGRLPRIDLGLELLAQAREAEPTDSTFGLGPGPRSEGEEARLTLRPLDRAMELVGVALDGAGATLASRQLVADLVLGSDLGFGATRTELVTDAEGRFRVFVDDEDRARWDGSSRRSLHLVTADGDPAAAGVADVDLPAQLVLGPNDLGELVLAPRTPLFAGEVRGEDGGPLELEYLWLVVKRLPEDRRVRFVLDARKVVVGNRFAIFGEPVPLDRAGGEALVLQVTSAGRPGLAQVVVEGDLDLELVLPEAGFLAGSVALGPGQASGDYEVDFRAPALPGDHKNHVRASLARNGRFELAGLPRRAGDVEVRDGATGTLLAVVTDVVPGAEPGVVDPRLDGIEVQAEVDAYELQVDDVEGRGIEGATFASPRLPLRVASYGGGRFTWRAAGGSLDGRVAAPGYLARSVTLTPGERVVVLDRGPEVVVRPEPALDMPEGTRALLVLAGGERYEEIRLTDRGDGSYAGHVSGAGTYRARVRLVRRGVLVGELPLAADPDALIVVSSDGGLVEVDVATAPAVLEAGLGEE